MLQNPINPVILTESKSAACAGNEGQDGGQRIVTKNFFFNVIRWVFHCETPPPVDDNVLNSVDIQRKNILK